MNVPQEGAPAELLERFSCASLETLFLQLCYKEESLVRGGGGDNALWANHLKGWWFLFTLAIIRVAGCWSVCRFAAECAHGCCRMCGGCSFNILPCSSRLNQKIFYWKKNILSECVLKTKIIWKIDYFEDSIRQFETMYDDYACPDFI